MSKTTDSIYTLLNNPFQLSELLLEFYKNYTSISEKNILLAYIVFPLCLNPQFQDKRIMKTSSIRTLWSGSDKIAKEIFANLPDQIQEYKSLTNEALLYLVDRKYISIGDNLSICLEEDNFKKSGLLKLELKAVNNLIKILQQDDIPTIYSSLGVKKI